MQKQSIHVPAEPDWFVEIDLNATGERLRSKRRESNYSQEDLSELFERSLAPVSRVSISQWENGKKQPSLQHLVFLRQLYNCSLDELVVSDRRPCDGDRWSQLSPAITIELRQGAALLRHTMIQTRRFTGRRVCCL